MRFPGHVDQPIIRYHKGRVDQAIAFSAWPTLDIYSDTRLARTTTVMQDILENRLIDLVRVAEGSTYSPHGESRPSEVYPGYGYLVNYVETPLPRVDAFFANVSKITSELRSKPPSADELTRAIKPRIEQITKAQQTNDYWMARLSGSIGDPRRLQLIRTSLPDYQSVRAEDVQAAARQFLTEKTQWKLVIQAELPTPPPGK